MGTEHRGEVDRLVSRRRRRRLAWIVGANAVFVVLLVIGWRTATRPATWPPELDPAPAEALFTDPVELTADDLVLFDRLITDIARRDPVVLGLLDGRPWPDPDIQTALWSEDGSPGRAVVIGGSFQLELGGTDYSGPWPSANCHNGRYRGTVRNIEAVGLEQVVVVVDLAFERVTNVVVPPSFPPSDPSAPGDATGPTTEFGADLPDAPWYTGTCPLTRGPN